ncbi:MAG: alpha-1,4-glucan--maltose-1-phosphate maltosyltransferase [Actinomycetes bacterium]
MIGRIPITDIEPVVGLAEWPAKAVVGETVPVSATVFREGHDAVNANVVLRGPNGSTGPYTPMTPAGAGLDRWTAEVTPDRQGAWTYTVEAWSDPYATWAHDAEIKIAAGVDVELMLEEGARLFERAAASPSTASPSTASPSTARTSGSASRPADDVRTLTEAAAALRDTSRPVEARLAAGLDPRMRDLLVADPLRDLVTSSRPMPLLVERERALFSAWYEFFPRSEGAAPDADGVVRPGNFRTAAERLPAVAAMGFDVVYLPPIHPVGEANRKGPNNTLTPGPDDVGSPWAIGSRHGGHDAIDPALGDFDDFDAFVGRAKELGLEVALDLALQAAPDHPWVEAHPEWFTVLADGTIAYAENPPKKYQDIYPINFDRDPDGIRNEVLRVVRLWMSHGVRIFRVDNPHTKPVAFWEWLIGKVHETDPDVIFLAEAFTRPAMMRMLGKIGFTQSYTYFTWRTEKTEIEEYLLELAHETSAYMRPNFWPNTPDILNAYLQYGGPPAFKIRATLAATGSPSWGVYSGFELYEHVAVRPGSEEYLDSEKYQLRPRPWAEFEPGGPREGQSLAGYLTRLNQIRRAHPALQQLRHLAVHETEGDGILCFSKRSSAADDADVVLVCLNLDPHGTRETTVHLDMPALGLAWDEPFEVVDEITGASYTWGTHNYIRLDPFVEPAHIFRVRRMPRA